MSSGALTDLLLGVAVLVLGGSQVVLTRVVRRLIDTQLDRIERDLARCPFDGNLRPCPHHDPPPDASKLH
jgi:hypothetical protein